MSLSFGGRAIALASCLPIALLAGCSGEADKAAAPVPGMMRSLGVDNLSHGKAGLPGNGVVSLSEVSGEIRGYGPVAAGELLVEGLGKEGGRPTRVTARRVSAPLKADSVVVELSASGAPQGMTHLEGVEARALGVPFKAARVSYGKVPEGTSYVATGLRATDDAALPAALSLLAAADWEVEAVVRDIAPGRIGLEVRRARSSSGELTAAASILLPEGRDASYLSGLTARDLLDPARWPEGSSLKALEVSGSLMAPPGGIPTTGGAEDERTRAMLAAAAAVRGPARWTVSLAPRQPVPMRDLERALRAPSSAADLRLEVSVREIPSAAQPPR